MSKYRIRKRTFLNGAVFYEPQEYRTVGLDPTWCDLSTSICLTEATAREVIDKHRQAYEFVDEIIKYP